MLPRIALLLLPLFTMATMPLPIPADAPPLATARHAMVVTEQRLATQAGLAVLRRGGNAVDAAVAVGYALAVVDPCCGNIGGGGFMLVRMRDGRERFIDFREKAPLKATRDMYLDAQGNAVAQRSRKGWLAIGVPGTVMGMERARTEFGTLPRATLMAPAIALADQGFVLVPGDLIPFEGSFSEGYSGAFAFQKQPNIRAVWMPDGKPPHAGERIVQKNLERTLRLISRDGADAFYRGPIAKAVVAASTANGGILSLDDFAKYTVDEAAPIHCSYRGYDIASLPPPSSGGTTLCETLNVIAPLPIERWGWHSVEETHYLIEAERRTYADRNADLGDPAFVHNPIAKLLDLEHAAHLRASIDPVKATPSTQIKTNLDVGFHENTDTTHVSIVDKDGNAVAFTYTINDWFGASVVAGDTGFFLNDEMDDFTAKVGTANMFGLVQGRKNGVEPGKRPLSSMTPAIVTKDGAVAMVTGSPGGSRIITITLETILNALVFGMNAEQAVDAPRIHMQWFPDEIQYEPGALDDATIETLRADGYAFKQIRQWGSAQAIIVDPKTGVLTGGSDRRRSSGAALGY